MRIFYVSLALLLVIITGLFWYSHFLDSRSGQMLSLLDTLSRAAEEEDWPGTEKAMEEVSRAWENLSPRLALFTDHALLDDIMLTAAAADGYVRYREVPELRAEIETLYALISHIPNREKFSLYNIF